MTYEIALAPAAARQLGKFDPPVRRRLQAAIELLAVEPRPPGATQLVGGAGEWRVRTGDYRIVYEIHDDLVIVLVLSVGHRTTNADRAAAPENHARPRGDDKRSRTLSRHPHPPGGCGCDETVRM